MGEFKHISVTAPEENDVVITAGLRTGANDAHEQDGAPGQDGTPDQGGAFESCSVPASTTGTPPASKPASAEPLPEKGAGQPAAEASVRAPSSSGKRDGYHETTLADLRSSPMPTAQKIVIIAAVVCIIGALIYYFAFMR